jgi:hypothetical protein
MPSLSPSPTRLSSSCGSLERTPSSILVVADNAPTWPPPDAPIPIDRQGNDPAYPRPLVPYRGRHMGRPSTVMPGVCLDPARGYFFLSLILLTDLLS